jgi:serine/threonine protein kinase HipA of HipAB toxin-antitoxin module
VAYRPVDVIEVLAWGDRVGAVALDPATGYYVFEYSPTWRAGGTELAPTTMPLDRDRYVFPALPVETFHRLPAMLADSLPDAFGNALTTAYLVGEGIPTSAITPLDRLAYLSSRGLGALEFRPSGPEFEQWLLKLDGVGADLDLGESAEYGRIEYAYSLMAKAARIDMTACRLLREGGRAHFMTRRFDRLPDGSRVHTQSLCALAQLDFRLVGAHDYGQLFETVERLGLGSDSVAEVFRRMIFNVAAANCDDHTKNFSFLLPEGGAWQLAPAYDVTHAHSPDSYWTAQHLMAVNGRARGIGRSDLSTVGDRFEVRDATAITGAVLDAVDSWSECADQAGVSPGVKDEVGADITAMSAPLR